MHRPMTRQSLTVTDERRRRTVRWTRRTEPSFDWIAAGSLEWVFRPSGTAYARSDVVCASSLRSGRSTAPKHNLSGWGRTNQTEPRRTTHRWPVQVIEVPTAGSDTASAQHEPRLMVLCRGMALAVSAPRVRRGRHQGECAREGGEKSEGPQAGHVIPLEDWTSRRRLPSVDQRLN